MAKLYFYYGAMNAGKSTHLLQAAHNYEERGMNVCIFSYQENSFESKIKSRIGIEREVISFWCIDIFASIFIDNKIGGKKISAVFVDEAQFLRKKHIYELVRIVDKLSIPVICYGLRTDFQGNLFEGSSALLAVADEIIEIKSICHCGKKATMQARIDSEGNRVRDGEQVMIGGNESYVSLCRRHFFGE